MIDLDGPEGLWSFKGLTTRHEYHHAGPISSTGEGFHLYFALTGARNGVRLLPRIDVRGNGGYVVRAR